MKKYELTDEAITVGGMKLYRIRAITDFRNIKKGRIGGFIEKEENLSQTGNAWIDGTAWVMGNARVYEDARIGGDSMVYGRMRICGSARIGGNARVKGNARIDGNARIMSNRDYTINCGYGSENRTTTFFRTNDGGIGVRCGCFGGTIQEFKNKVNETHGTSEYAEEYIILAELQEKHFRRQEGKP